MTSAIIIGSVIGIPWGIALILAIIYIYVWRRLRLAERREGNHMIEIISSTVAGQGGAIANIFSLKELETATNGFADDLKLGSGGFGTVYKGTLRNGEVVAVKKSNHVGLHSKQQFLNEVTILSLVNHRNLVRLLGCCLETAVPILVYEYIANGNLYEHLHRKLPAEVQILDWRKRLQIAIETAEALTYLHSSARPPIYHRDVKSSNILLDETLTVRVADFGISRLVPLEATHVSTAAQGTPGYIDPEYFFNFQMTDKSDVYSFGVVLLELLTSLKPLDFARDSEAVNLAGFASKMMMQSGGLEDMMDGQLKTAAYWKPTEAQSVAQLALVCLATRRTDRPSMKEVVDELHRIRGQSRTQAFESFEGILSDEEVSILAGVIKNSTDSL